MSPPLVVMAVCMTGWLLASDVDPSNNRARISVWVSTGVAIIVTLGIVLAAFALIPRPDNSHYLLRLALLLLLPLIFIMLYFFRAGATGRMKLSILGSLAIVVCLIGIAAFPQQALYLWPSLILLFAGTSAADASWIPAFTRPDSGEPPAEPEIPGPAGPVSIAFLHANAGSFLKSLNTPFPLFHNIAQESDHVYYSSHPPLIGKLIRRLSKLTERWGIPWCRFGSARLYPDGSVEYEVYSKDGFPAHWGTVEEEQERVSDYITKSWASFAAGDETAARALTPDFFPENIYPARKGRKTLTIGFYAVIAIMAAITIYQLIVAP